MRCNRKGELFLGKSFGALTGCEPPLFLSYLDSAFLSMIIKRRSLLLFRLLQSLPIRSLREFLAAAEGVYEVCVPCVSATIALTLQARLPHGFNPIGTTSLALHAIYSLRRA